MLMQYVALLKTVITHTVGSERCS